MVTMNSDDVLATLLSACPGIEPIWQEHLEYWNGEEAGIFNDIAVIAHVIVDLAKRGETESLDAFFLTVEQCFVASDEDARGLLVVGLL